jgi:hypothetical protein
MSAINFFFVRGIITKRFRYRERYGEQWFVADGLRRDGCGVPVLLVALRDAEVIISLQCCFYDCACVRPDCLHHCAYADDLFYYQLLILHAPAKFSIL